MGPQTEPSISEGLSRWNPRRSRREGGQFNVTLPHKPVDIEGNWTPQWETNYTFTINRPGKWQLWFLLFKDERPSLPGPIKGDYAQTNATQRILDAIEGKIQALKLNIEVRGI